MQTDAWLQTEKSSVDTSLLKQVHDLEQMYRPYSEGKMMRLIDLKGETKILPDYYIEELIRELEIYGVCGRHNVAFFTKKAYKLHLQQEHAY